MIKKQNQCASQLELLETEGLIRARARARAGLGNIIAPLE